MILLAVDPSIRSSGAALFVDDTLVGATCIRVHAAGADEFGARWLAMSRLIVTWRQRQVAPLRLDVIVFERPQIYAGRKMVGDPNDLPGLAAIGAGVAALLATDVTRVRTPTPAEWAGQTSKSKTGDPWGSVRGARVASRLSAAERALVPASHDVIDAVGIGLWACGRFDRRRVFPGAN